MSCPICNESLFKFKMVDKKVIILNQKLFSCSNEHIQCRKCNKKYGNYCQICLDDTFPLGYRVKDTFDWEEDDIKDRIYKTKVENENNIHFTRVASGETASLKSLEAEPSPSEEDVTQDPADKNIMSLDRKTEQKIGEDGEKSSSHSIQLSHDENIDDLQTYYGVVSTKLRRVVKSLKRHKSLIPPSALKIPKTLMPCPDDYCRYIGDIPLFNEHLQKSHAYLPQIRIAPEKCAEFVLDPDTIKHNIVRAFMIYQVEGILEPVKDDGPGGLLPLMLMGTRVKLQDIGNHILLWLGGPVFHNFPLTVTIGVSRTDKLPIEKKTTCVLRSLYESPNPLHILQSGGCVTLSEREERKFTRHEREFLNIGVTAHW